MAETIDAQNLEKNGTGEKCAPGIAMIRPTVEDLVTTLHKNG